MRFGRLVPLLCAGCNLVFGVDVPATPDARDPMAPRCTEDLAQIDLPLDADAYLDANEPAVAYGTEPVLRLAPARSVLLRFAKGATTLRTIAFELPLATMARGCATGGDACEICPLPMQGTASLIFIKPTWTEAEATQLDRSAGTPWAQAGARGSDELGLACTASLLAPVLACEAQVPATAQVPDTIAVVVRVGPTGDATFAARENLGDCGASPVRAVGTCLGTSTACGNRGVDPGEECDDGNAVDGDNCDNNCTVTRCGNGIVTANESCDDANTESGDGCDYDCTPTGCGNSVITGWEECDDGNSNPMDGCHNCFFWPPL